jgi:hypothetical protein
MFIAGFGVGLCATFLLQAFIGARRVAEITRHQTRIAEWRRRNPDIVTTWGEAAEPTELDQ